MTLPIIFNWSVARNFFWLKFVVQLPLTDIFKLFKQPHAELYQRGLLRLAPENSFYHLISAFFNGTSRQQIYRIRADSVRQTVKDEFYPVGFSVFHLLKFGGKQLGYFHHRKKEKITDNSQLVHSFLGGGWSGCYLCIFALHDLRSDFGYVQGRSWFDIAIFFVNVSATGLIAMVAERYVAIVHSLKYVCVFTTARRTFLIIGACWGFPFPLTAMYLAGRRHSVVKTHIFDIISILLFVVLPTVLLLTAHIHILLIARKLSLQMRTLMKQVRFNITANSLKIMEIRNVGVKVSTVRLVSVLVTIFTACCGIRLYVFLCSTFKICFVSKHTLVIYRLLLLVNSTMNPLVYAFLKEDIKRESKAFLCRKRHVKILPFQVHPELQVRTEKISF